MLRTSIVLAVFYIFITGSPRAILQEAQVDIIPRDTCNRLDWYAGTIFEDMLCAGLETGGVDSCQVKWRCIDKTSCHVYAIPASLKTLAF